MVEQLTAGFINVFSSGFTILVILSGACIGIVMGAIPGLTANMAIALLIPLTFVMPTIPAIAMLIAISKGGTFGGSISAILINAPGSPAATATAMDGFELAKKGKALKALKMALHASCIGDMFSDIILILVAAQLAKVALMCGPVHPDPFCPYDHRNGIWEIAVERAIGRCHWPLAGYRRDGSYRGVPAVRLRQCEPQRRH